MSGLFTIHNLPPMTTTQLADLACGHCAHRLTMHVTRDEMTYCAICHCLRHPDEDILKPHNFTEVGAPAPDLASARIFYAILQTCAVGATVSINSLRHLTTQAQIPPAALGACFKAACEAGFLTATGSVVPSDEPAARGRLVRLYVLARRPEIGRAA